MRFVCNILIIRSSLGFSTQFTLNFQNKLESLFSYFVLCKNLYKLDVIFLKCVDEFICA